jgi:glucose/arabinose dehydrogenase
MKLKSLILTLFSVSLATVSVAKASEAASLTVVADNLNNPRGFAFAPDGSIYLTESGSGGSGADGRCIPSPSSQYIPLCAAENGSLIKIAPNGQQQTILGNLPSIALSPTGEQAAGPADIKFDSQGNAYLLTGLAGDPNLRDTVLGEPQLGRLFKVDLNTGSLTSIADFGSYEAANNPDGTDIISNPFAFTIQGENAYVVDGGGNTIYQVGLEGPNTGIQKVAAFPHLNIPVDQLIFPPGSFAPPAASQNIPPGYVVAPNGIPVSEQSVPTSIAIAPDGSLTVGEYTGYPYPEGAARIWSVDGNLTTTGYANGAPLTGTQIATGFTQVTGVAYDPQGDLYVLQHINTSEWKNIEQGGNVIGDISSSIFEITPNGTRTTVWSGNGLDAAATLAFGPDGDLYVSNNSRLAGGKGELVKIDVRSVPEPSSTVEFLSFGAVGLICFLKGKRKQTSV